MRKTTLQLLLGGSGSGKTTLLYQRIRARAEKGEKSILLVPEQFTSSTEGLLYRTLGDSLSAYVESYSFTSLAETILRRYGGAAVQTLDEAGRALLVRRAVDSLLDKVVYYSRQRKSAAFCEKAKQYDLALVPGDSFGCPGYFRMAYCIDTEKVRRSFAALEKFVAEEYGK